MKTTALSHLLPLLIAAILPVSAAAQNPMIHDQFTADPTARVFNGRMYMYPSHDIPSPVEKLKEWFCMADYHVFSSDNLVDWTDHGVIVSQERVPWVDAQSYSMWAPDCVEKDGRYYFYFPAAPGNGGRGFNVGVAVADSPEGPFSPMQHPVEGINGIDPCVLIDDDGTGYIYWAGGGMRGARLADNMVQLASEPVEIAGLPDGFKEGPFVFKRNGKYYYTFPWVRDNTETLAYAMGDSPLGPFEFKGVIMDESPSGCWTNHHSIVNYNDRWYLFYHHNDYSPGFDKNRSVRIDSLAFTPDGLIGKVTPTLRGVGLSDARGMIQIDRYSAISPGGVKVEFLDRNVPFDGWKCVFGKKGAWVRYDRVDFGDKPAGSMTVRARAPKGGVLRVATSSGMNVADVRLPASRGWASVECEVAAPQLTGVCNLVVTLLSGKNVEVDWVGFDAR